MTVCSRFRRLDTSFILTCLCSSSPQPLVFGWHWVRKSYWRKTYRKVTTIALSPASMLLSSIPWFQAHLWRRDLNDKLSYWQWQRSQLSIFSRFTVHASSRTYIFFLSILQQRILLGPLTHETLWRISSRIDEKQKGQSNTAAVWKRGTFSLKSEVCTAASTWQY